MTPRFMTMPRGEVVHLVRADARARSLQAGGYTYTYCGAESPGRRRTWHEERPPGQACRRCRSLALLALDDVTDWPGDAAEVGR